MPYWGSNAIALFPTYFQNHQPLHQDSEFHAQPSTSQPWPIGHATRTTFNQLTFNLSTFNLSTLAYWPRYANNLQPANLQPSTSQPSTS
ncbi:hypothetical protein [Moorena producens]|uniref:hypothetical protein n=1 Tax=Moorena producens TaxID=1155739 RepID=UPI003C71E8CE